MRNGTNGQFSNKERAAKSHFFVKSGQFSNKKRGGVGSGRVKISPIFVENSKFENKECASSSPIFVENSLFSKKEFRQTWSIFKEGVRVAVSGRVGRQFAFSYSFSTTRPRFARVIKSFSSMFNSIQFNRVPGMNMD